MSFNELGLNPQLQRAVDDAGYTTPTPIQAEAIPIILQKRDLLGCAQTGTGKTAAFSIPMLQLLFEEKLHHEIGYRQISALILTPTRELAIQIEESLAAYGKYTGLRHLVIFGGVSQVPQVQALRHGVDILVATPGRLLDLINQRIISLKHIRFFVLDEADRMLDMGFVHDVKRIIRLLPAERQSLFFSATMPPEIQQLAGTILHNPATVEVTPVSSTADTIQQQLYYVHKKDKKFLLVHLLKDATIKSVLVFTRTKHGADKVVKDLIKSNISAEAIHGNKSQNARQRALTNFKSGQTRVLVATDIAARGIDIDELGHVINYELPNVAETYVHRIGRTGRAGNSGLAISFCEGEEIPYVRDIQHLIGKAIPVVDNHPYATDLASLAEEATTAPPKQQQRPRRDKQPQTAKPKAAPKQQQNNKQRPHWKNKQGNKNRFNNSGTDRLAY